MDYDAANQLIKATIEHPNQPAEVWHYVYDAFGRRMSKQQEGNTETLRLFTWDGARLIQEETAQHKYTYVYRDQGSFEPLAQVVEELNSEEVPKRDVYYYHTDQVGIPKEVTDAEGNLAWYGHYKAWGQLKEEHNLLNIHQPFRLQNQYFDNETGLHYNLLRYYDPHYGRFINQDPIGLAGGANLYQFAANAIEWTDPLGLSGAKLARNLIKNGTERLAFTQAHHIVPETCTEAADARKILKEYKIDINSHENGVFLPGCPQECEEKGIRHCGYHGKKYSKKVTERIVAASKKGNRQAIIDELSDIRKILQNADRGKSWSEVL